MVTYRERISHKYSVRAGSQFDGLELYDYNIPFNVDYKNVRFFKRFIRGLYLFKIGMTNPEMIKKYDAIVYNGKIKWGWDESEINLRRK